MKEYKLTSEIVPSSSWYNNVRSNVTKKEWDILRRKSYEAAGHKCEICGETGKEQGYNHNVECHEIWKYDDENHSQTLVGLISLCPRCHKVKHPGLAQIKGESEIVLQQLMKVNGVTEDDAKEYLVKAFDTFFKRSRHKWELDITYLEEYLKEDENLTWWEKAIKEN